MIGKYLFSLSFLVFIGFALDAQISVGQSTSSNMLQTTDTVKVLFSKPGGFYTNSFSLKLDVPDQSYTILYTIDGSNPQTSATVQNGGKTKTLTVNPLSSSGRPQTPCYIVRASLKKDGQSSGFPLTQTYIFIDQVIAQSYPGGGWPSGAYVNDQMIDLGMDPDITLGYDYSNLINDALTDIPSISVVTDLKNLFDPTIGIYVNALNHSEDWEKFCSVELLDPSGKPGFNINAGLRIRGGWSRHGNYPKHGFRLFFREEYGAPKLKFPLFENEGVGEFDKIDLRCEQNYSWANGYPFGDRNTCVREVFSRDTQRDMGQPYTRSRYYHLYLNGMYWGLYQTQERSEARYAADYFGGKVEDYDVVKVNADGYYVEATDGNLDSWIKLYNLCGKGFANNSDYFALEGKDENGNPKKGSEVMVDIDNMIDYLLGIFYTGNFDAPTSSFMGNSGVNNFYAIDNREDKSKGFVFFNHDGEHAMMVDPASPGIGLYEDRVNLRMSVSDVYHFHPQWLHYRLTSNMEYRMRVADRVYKSFFNTGVFTPDAAQERFQKRVDEINLAIIGESARWGDAQVSVPYTKQTWEDEVDDIYDRFFPYRTDIVLDQLREANLYPKFDPPVFKKNNGILDREVYTISGNTQVAISSTFGQILYTLDGSDPRLIGGKISASAREIETDGKIDLFGTTILKARVKIGDDWSALHEIKFVNPNEDYTNLKVTELNYHPTDSIKGKDTVSGKSFEFIELKNTGTNSINLTGLKFTSSVQYNFKENEVLPSKQFYVIASKPKWFYDRYAMIPSGGFDNNFSNSGEQIIISTSNGKEIINFQYSDINPWATKPDGEGYTLSSVIRNPTGNPNDYSYWKASTRINGSPFGDDPGIADSKEELPLSGNSVMLYPNPTKGILYLKTGEVKSDGNIEIYTLSGTRIFGSAINEDSFIDLNRLNITPGIYLLKVQVAGGNSVHKVIYQP